MKRIGIVLSSLLVLFFLPLAATAAEEAPESESAAAESDSAAASTTVVTARQQSEHGDFESVTWIDAEAQGQTCTAQLDCEDGNVISCTGTQSCTVDHWNGTVNCDGNTTQCPNWCKATLRHECPNCGERLCSCTSLSGDCSVGNTTVTCDGQEHQCLCPFGC